MILFLLQGGGAYWLWRWLTPKPMAGVTNPMVAMALFGLFALVLFLLGKFSAALARLEDNRLLRPGAGYLLLGAYLCFVVALAIATIKGALVLLYFMHLRWDRPFNAFVLVSAIVFVMLFVAFALLDSKQYQPDLIPGYAPQIQSNP